MSAFVQTLACHQYSAKPISKSILICCQWGPWWHIPIIFTMFNFSFIEDAFVYADSLVQDCGISIANALETPQSCIYPTIDVNRWVLAILSRVYICTICIPNTEQKGDVTVTTQQLTVAPQAAIVTAHGTTGDHSRHTVSPRPPVFGIKH